MRSRSKSLPKIPERWTVATGTYDGNPLVLRANAGAQGAAGDPHIGYQVGIAVPLNAPRADGLPDTGEEQELGVVEELIRQRLQEAGLAWLVAVISTGGMREFVLYTGDPEGVEVAVDALRDEVASHEIQVMVQEDPDWEVYQQFS